MKARGLSLNPSTVCTLMQKQAGKSLECWPASLAQSVTTGDVKRACLKIRWNGETAVWSRAQVALVEDRVRLLASTGCCAGDPNSSSKGSDTLVWPPQALHAHSVCISYMWTKYSYTLHF